MINTQVFRNAVYVSPIYGQKAKTNQAESPSNRNHMARRSTEGSRIFRSLGFLFYPQQEAAGNLHLVNLVYNICYMGAVMFGRYLCRLRAGASRTIRQKMHPHDWVDKLIRPDLRVRCVRRPVSAKLPDPVSIGRNWTSGGTAGGPLQRQRWRMPSEPPPYASCSCTSIAPFWAPATWRSLAQASIWAESPFGDVPTTRVLRRTQFHHTPEIIP